jgi:hypothetical protein
MGLPCSPGFGALQIFRSRIQISFSFPQSPSMSLRPRHRPPADALAPINGRRLMDLGLDVLALPPRSAPARSSSCPHDPPSRSTWSTPHANVRRRMVAPRILASSARLLREYLSWVSSLQSNGPDKSIARTRRTKRASEARSLARSSRPMSANARLRAELSGPPRCVPM